MDVHVNVVGLQDLQKCNPSLVCSHLISFLFVAKTHLLQIRANEHKVDTAEAQLGHTDEYVHQTSHRSGPAPQLWWTILETLLHRLRVVRTHSFSLEIAHLLGAGHQDMLAVDGHHRYHHG